MVGIPPSRRGYRFSRPVLAAGLRHKLREKPREVNWPKGHIPHGRVPVAWTSTSDAWDAGDHAADLEELAPAVARRRLLPQLHEIALALALVLLVQALQVLDREFLHVLEVDGAPLAHVQVEQRRVGLAAADPAELRGEI